MLFCFISLRIDVNSADDFCPNVFIWIYAVFLQITSYSISFMIIVSRVTGISFEIFHRTIVSITSVHAGHLIQVMTSLSELSSVISTPSTCVTISHHLSHDFSAGLHVMGLIISSNQGWGISTYAPIHSYSPLSASVNHFDSIGGK